MNVGMTKLDAIKLIGLLEGKTRASWAYSCLGFGLIVASDEEGQVILGATRTGTGRLSVSVWEPHRTHILGEAGELSGRGWHVRAAALLAEQPEVKHA